MLGRRIADDERPRHVRPAGGLLVARPDVDVDREPGRERPAPGLVAGALPDRGDDHIRRAGRAVFGARLPQDCPNVLGEQGSTVGLQAPVRVRAASRE